MDKYVYDGPIMIFDRCVASNWHGETFAESLKKAKSNLAYQCKKACGLIPSAKITLPGKVKMVGGKEKE